MRREVYSSVSAVGRSMCVSGGSRRLSGGNGESGRSAKSGTCLSRTMRSLMIDVSPLRASPEFRLVFTARVVSLFGIALTTVGVPWQVYAMTRSSLAPTGSSTRRVGRVVDAAS